MKKKKESKNKKNTNISTKKITIAENIPKEIGSFHDFLVYENNDKDEPNYYFEKCNDENPFLKDWLVLKNKPKTESRFADLFKEIMENDKKAALEEQNNKNNTNKINYINDINDKKLDNQNSINIENNEELDNKNNKNNINIINEDNDNLSINNNHIKCNPINCQLKQIKEEEEFNNINSFDSINNNNNCIKDYSNNNSINNNTSEYLLNTINSGNNNPYIENNYYNHHKNSVYSNSSSLFGVSTNDSDYCGSLSSMSNNNINSFERNNSILEKNFKLIVDIRRVIFLEDKRTTIMIKNIPNKFTGDFLLNIIDQNFKGTFNLFILPTDTNKCKNFGYAFINFTSSYFIPYFYYMFNGKMWSSTNSQKVCKLTYSKIQGKKGLISHYIGKIVYQNDSLRVNSEQKFIIPNEFGYIFRQAFPKQYIEEYKYYFLTKIPGKK